jgi:hypothetical protein
MAAVLQTVEPHPASVDAYIRAGWSLVPIPPGVKGPRTVGWNRPEAALKSQADLPPGWGIGLAHAYSSTMALDVDDYAAAKILLPDLDALFAAPDAVAIESGNPGHGKLIFAMPFGIRLPSRKVGTAYELRCATADGLTVQDVIPPSIHPGTGQPYRWAGRGDWQHLPLLPPALLELWQSMLNEPAPPSAPLTGTVDWNEVRSAVNAIDADCSRDEWIAVGMALHRESPDGGLQVWQEWSQRGQKYPGDRQIAAQWRSFRDDKATSVGMGTLFKIASDHGWQRPAPDAAALFGPIDAPQNVAISLRPVAPKIDLDQFPPVLSRRCREVAQSIGCDPLVPLFAGLAAVCACADSRSRLRIVHGYEVSPVLWLMTIGDPADKKTPGAKPMLAELAEIEREDRPRFAKAMEAWEVQQAIWAGKKKSVLDWAKSADATLGGEHEEIGECAPAPVPLRLTVQDITSQKLVRHAAERPEGVLCNLDEMSGWARKICDPRSGEDRAAWTRSYNGERYEMDRVGSGTIIADPFNVSVFGNIQPRVYREHFEGMSIDGLLQRFIPGVLDGALTRQSEPMPVEQTNEVEWSLLLRTVYALPAQTYTLAPDAYLVFREFQGWYDQRRRDERLLMSADCYREALGKVEGTCGRLALVLHLIECPFSTVVSADVMTRAVAIMRGYVIPALRYSLGEIGGETSLDQWLQNWIIIHADEASVTLSEIKRASHRQTGAAGVHGAYAIDQLILGAMRVIEQAGWVARTDDGQREHQHIATWAINPVLMVKFAADRQERIAARQRQLDEIYKANPHGRTKFAHGYTP